MCHVGISDEGGSSSTVIGLCNDCKWVFDKAYAMSWCHGVVCFQLTMSRL